MSEANATLEELVSKGHVVPCGDEAGVSRWNGGGYGWRRAGGRDAAKTTFSLQSVKMFGALSKDGFYMRPADALNSATFISYHKELRQTHPKFVMILDNAGYHKSLVVSRFIESTGGDIKLIYLPPYTPQLNPIEVQYMALKRLLAGQYFESVDELRDAIVQNEMKPVEIKGYVTWRRRALRIVPAPCHNTARFCRPFGHDLEWNHAIRAILGRIFTMAWLVRRDCITSGLQVSALQCLLLRMVYRRFIPNRMPPHSVARNTVLVTGAARHPIGPRMQHAGQARTNSGKLPRMWCP